MAIASSVRASRFPDLERDLVGGEIVATDAGRHREGDGQAPSQRGGTDEEIDAVTGHVADDPRVGSHVDAVSADGRADPGHEDGRGDPLGNDGGERRRPDALVESVDEYELEHEVEQRGADRDVERPPRVLEAPEVSDPGQHDEHRGHAEQ